MLLAIFLSVALKHVRSSLFQLLLLGGAYELMSDGILGSLPGGTYPRLVVYARPGIHTYLLTHNRSPCTYGEGIL